MKRCLDLASLGAGMVAPNPMVGAVLVYGDRVIGEGCHERYGEAHAEVNCIRSVKSEDRELIPQSTLYVSLEPCAHTGKTPPCADLIIRERIPKVVIGCRDPFPEVNGKGIERLQQAGVEITLGVLEAACRDMNRRFFTFHQSHRPFIILKWAETANGLIGSGNKERLLISNEYSNRLVHRWRSEEAAILIGTNTALLDDPLLNNRLWEGPSPRRLVIDRTLRLPGTLRLFNSDQQTIIFNEIKQEEAGRLLYQQLQKKSSSITQILECLYEWKQLSLLVEGGAALLQSFINQGVWDEARVIRSSANYPEYGVRAPVLDNHFPVSQQTLLTDTITIFKHDH